jgi:rabenosyn-5
MSFLHIHMLPLKSLPKLLKHATPTTVDGHLAPPADGHRSKSPLAAIKSDSNAPSVSSDSAISSLEVEEKELRERLIVLEEQKFMVGEMLADAQRRRKFEEVEALGRNVEDLSKEIDGLQKMLGHLDIAVQTSFLGGVTTGR